MRTPMESQRILQRLHISDSKELRQRYGLKPYENCLWEIINPHSDIPVGNLHWMYLGLGKHLIKKAVEDLDEGAKQHLELLIDSADYSSFSNKIQTDMIRYIDSRQGKDIKQYLQLAPYHMKIAGLSNNKVKLLCKLAEICNMVSKKEFKTQDMIQLNTKLTNYIESLREIYPSLLQRVKTHLSSHLAEKSTENFEKGRMRTPMESQRILQRLHISDSKELRQRYGLKPYENCLWEIINPHSDIPVGNLHWMYLGLGKHLIKKAVEDLDEGAKQHLELLIDSADYSSFSNKIQTDMIRYIDSRQGKDIKQYLQLAPYHMKIAGLSNNKVKLLCKLAEICNMVSKKEFKTQDMIQLNTKLTNYIESLREIYPSLLQRVKTHLSSHLVDDITNHGPPDSYKEDAFEKMHGRIRDQIFLQNQHATSRDTAISFAEMEILSHVTTGGFFLKDGIWVQATENVKSCAEKKEIKAFLGKPVDTINNKKLVKAERGANRKIIPNAHFKAARCINGDLVNEGNAVLYKDEGDSEQEYIGIFKYGTEVFMNERKQQNVFIQKLRKVPPSTNLGFYSERFLLIEETISVGAQCLMMKVCILHDCLSGGCHKKESTKSVKLEQQVKDVKQLIWYHCPRNNFFYLNKFRMSHNDLKI